MPCNYMPCHYALCTINFFIISRGWGCQPASQQEPNEWLNVLSAIKARAPKAEGGAIRNSFINILVVWVLHPCPRIPVLLLIIVTIFRALDILVHNTMLNGRLIVRHTIAENGMECFPWISQQPAAVAWSGCGNESLFHTPTLHRKRIHAEIRWENTSGDRETERWYDMPGYDGVCQYSSN